MTQKERFYIGKRCDNGINQAIIARELQLPRSTISRELRRNIDAAFNGVYSCRRAETWLFYLGCALLSFGAALATPAYQLLLNDKLADDAGAGWIATSHTLGYGLSALLVPLVSKTGAEAALITVVFLAAVLFTVMSGVIWRSRHCSRHSAI